MIKQNKKQKKLNHKNKPVAKLHKMYIYFVIVNYGYSEYVMKLMQSWGSNVQIGFMGRGTANKQALHVLGLENSSKEIIMAFVDDTNINQIKEGLEKNFKVAKNAMGFSFTIELTSIVGERIYHFLTNTL